LFKILISTPHSSLEPEQRQLTRFCTWRYALPSCQVLKLHLLSHSKRSAYFTIVSVYWWQCNLFNARVKLL